MFFLSNICYILEVFKHTKAMESKKLTKVEDSDIQAKQIHLHKDIVKRLRILSVYDEHNVKHFMEKVLTEYALEKMPNL